MNVSVSERRRDKKNIFKVSKSWKSIICFWIFKHWVRLNYVLLPEMSSLKLQLALESRSKMKNSSETKLEKKFHVASSFCCFRLHSSVIKCAIRQAILVSLVNALWINTIDVSQEKTFRHNLNHFSSYSLRSFLSLSSLSTVSSLWEISDDDSLKFQIQQEIVIEQY